jgi:hypothetical protein
LFASTVGELLRPVGDRLRGDLLDFALNGGERGDGLGKLALLGDLAAGSQVA